MARLFISILFIFFIVGAFGNHDASVKEDISDLLSGHESSCYENEHSSYYLGIVPEKIVTDTNLLTGTGLQKKYLSFDSHSVEVQGIRIFLEDRNLACLILKDNLFLSILLI